MPSIRVLKPEEIESIRKIDRAEEIHEYYVFKNGGLILEANRVSVAQFDPDELDKLISNQHQLLQVGGKIIGAFDSNELVGVASVESQLRGRTANYCKMDILYVSRGFRSSGIGKLLLQECMKTAREFGAEKLYISATPTKNTVDFYLNNGALITKELDTALFRMEPLDIHLEISLYRA